ncbi:MAG: hypothetical protein H7099_12050 [Gemmatimonadaceae bacterium]|nr:hypothetical protein [Gemmatimonadaceae bacterium]
MSVLGRAGVCILVICACGSQRSGVGTPLPKTNPTISFVCTPMLTLRVRFDATSATVYVDGDGPYSLPQVNGRSDYTVYSDGQHMLQIYQSNASYGIGRARLQPCTRS